LVKTYLWNVLIALDQLINTLAGGHPDETISSRAGKSVTRGRGWIPCVLCKLLNLIDPNHCIKNIETDEGEPI
jgi:citrate lyase alpha subunit